MSEPRRGKLPRSLLVCAALEGSWRQSPPPPNLSENELLEVAPLLVGSGGGGLLWWKIRASNHGGTRIAEELHNVYRHYVLQAAIHRREIKAVVELLKDVGVEPVLIKGWAIARSYPDEALRPYGDIDLLIHPRQVGLANDVLGRPEARGYFVDVHEGAAHLDETPYEDLVASSVVVELEGKPVRILRPEDHLRILVVHFLHHGAWRPAGLCDIALMLENLDSKFDWDRCLTSDGKRARWITCTIELAHRLLGANIDKVPTETRSGALPRWLEPAVLREWENPVSIEHVVPPPLAERLQHPLETVKAIRGRWPPNPIQATVVLNGPFNDWPRIIFQTGNYLSRSMKFFTKLVNSKR